MEESDEVPVTLIVSSRPAVIYSYNVPEGEEQDRNVLEANALFYNNPLSEKYSVEVYSSLKNIEQQCASDYVSLCAPQSSGVVDLMDIMQQLFSVDMSRRLTASPQQNFYGGLNTLDRLRSLYVDAPVEMGAASRRLLWHPSPPSSSSEENELPCGYRPKDPPNLRASGIPMDVGIPLGPLPIPFPMPVPEGPPQSALATNVRPMNGNAAKPMPSFRRDDDHSWSNDDHSGRDDDRNVYPPDDDSRPRKPKGGHHRGHHHPPPPPPPPPREDRYFPGALGFGAGGDMCMYNMIDQLSKPCLDSISHLHVLRQQYWTEQSAPPSHCHAGAFILGALLVAFLVRKLLCRKRREAIRNLLSKLHEKPELKLKVEQELGLTVPKPCNARPCHSRCQGVLLTIGVLLATLVGVLAVSISSLEITYAIVRSLDENALRNGEEPTSPTIALLILFEVCTVEVIFLELLRRLIKRFFERRSSSSPPPGSVPSAPLVHPVPDPEFNPPSPPSSEPSPFRQFSNRVATWLPTITPSFARRAQHDAYVPLLSEDTEMVAMGAPAPRVVYTGVPVGPGQVPFVGITPMSRVGYL